MSKVHDFLLGVKQILFKDVQEGYSLGVTLTNEDGLLILTDFIDRALVTVDFPHHEIHEGNYYDVIYKTPDGSDLADNGSIWIFLVTGNRYSHFEFAGMCGGMAEIHLYGEVAASASGTALTPINLNGASSNISQNVAFHTPTLSASGTALLPGGILLPGGEGGNAPGGIVRSGVERILNKNSAYAIRLVNRAGTAQPAGLVTEWYEPG